MTTRTAGYPILFRIFYWIRQPSFVLPIALITPVMSLAGYQIRISDLLVMALAIHFGVLLVQGARIPKIAVIFFSIWSVAWLAANLNGIGYGIAFNLADLNFFYRVIFIISALSIGLFSTEPIDKIFMGPVAFLCFGAITVLCVLYYFGSGSERIALLEHFWPDRRWVHKIGLEWQFPGLGSSRNIFTGSILIAFTFTFYRAFRDNRRYWVPLMLVAITIFCGSRKALTVMAFVAAVEIFYVVVICRETKAIWFSSNGMRVRRERLPQLVAIILLVFTTVGAISQSDLGFRLTSRFIALAINVGVKESGLVRRLINMEGGISRISVAPILGVPQAKSSDNPFPHILVFALPHNEWLRLWMFYGLFGMLAFLFLIGALSYLNWREGMTIEWHLLYFGTFVQMMVDTAMYDFQYMTLFFICVGLNLRELSLRRAPAAAVGAARLIPAE